jgi:hypothetical protein
MAEGWFPQGVAIPDGYHVELTDERVEDGGEIGRRFFRWRADRLRRAHPPLIPSYHTRVEKVRRSDGRAVPFLWAVVAYQNRLVPVEPKEKQT